MQSSVPSSSRLFALVFSVAALGAWGCPDNGAGPGESCESSDDCEGELRCRDNKCIEPGTSGNDAGTDGGMTDAGPSLEEEDYAISYRLVDRAENTGKLEVYSTSTEERHTISGESMDCSANCWLTRDGSYLVRTERAGGQKVDVIAHEVGSDWSLTGNQSTVVSGVSEVRMGRNHVSYETESQQAAYRTIPDGEEQIIAPVEGSTDWVVAPEADRALIFEPGNASQSMTVKAGKATDRSSDGSVELGGPNFQETSGSYFTGSVAAARISSDGSRGAFVTVSPNDYGDCERSEPQSPYSSSACAEYTRCGTEERCTRLEITVHFIDFENVANLGTGCSSRDGGDDCGDLHHCSFPSEGQLDEAECIPGRTVIGVPETPPQNGAKGCAIVREDGSIDFTGFRGPLTFDREGRAYLVGRRDRSCLGDYSTKASQIVRIDPEKDGYRRLGGLGPEESFVPDDCVDLDNDRVDLENCNVFVGRAAAAPEGSEVAYSATNPNASSGDQAASVMNVWRMFRDGSERWFTGDFETETITTVESIRVHPPRN